MKQQELGGPLMAPVAIVEVDFFYLKRAGMANDGLNGRRELTAHSLYIHTHICTYVHIYMSIHTHNRQGGKYASVSTTVLIFVTDHKAIVVITTSVSHNVSHLTFVPGQVLGWLGALSDGVS